MFVGHAAMAFAARRAAPRASLGTLMAATFALDYLWPVFTLAGIERFSIVPGYLAASPLRFDHYPWSHSLAMAMVWAAVAVGIVRGVARRWPDAWLAGGLVVSHWLLDAVTHAPDLPLWPGSASMVGFGLWRSVPATIAVEGLLFAAGVLLYLQGRNRPRATWSLAILLLVMFGIWIAGPFSPPPPSTSAVTWSAMALLLLPVWARSIDRRGVAESGTSGPLAA